MATASRSGPRARYRDRAFGAGAFGMEPASSTPKELGDMIRSELARWTKVIKDTGIQPGPS